MNICAATGRGVIGREVRFNGHEGAHVAAVRCVAGKHFYKVRGPSGRLIVYHYFDGYPLKQKRTYWVPATVLKFVRRDYTS